jgi:hypothetical protein
VVATLDAITADDMTRVVRDVLRNEKLNLAIVGPHRSDRRFASLLNL